MGSVVAKVQPAVLRRESGVKVKHFSNMRLPEKRKVRT